MATKKPIVLNAGKFEQLQSGDTIDDYAPLASPTFTGTVTIPTGADITKPTMKGSVPKVSSYSPAASGTATLDLSDCNVHHITMPEGNITIALSNVTTNQIFSVDITQDGTGSRTVTWFTTIKWAGGSAPTLTTTGSKRDSFIFKCTGSNTYDGYIIGQNV